VILYKNINVKFSLFTQSTVAISTVIFYNWLLCYTKRKSVLQRCKQQCHWTNTVKERSL